MFEKNFRGNKNQEVIFTAQIDNHITAFNKTDQSYILASLFKNMNSIDLGHTENELSSKKKKKFIIEAYDILEK